MGGTVGLIASRLEKCAINRLGNFGVFSADWGSRMVYLVFRAIECYAALVPVPSLGRVPYR